MISAYGDIEVKLIVICNLQNILSYIMLLKNCKRRIYCNLDYGSDFCTVYLMWHLILMKKIKSFKIL